MGLKMKKWLTSSQFVNSQTLRFSSILPTIKTSSQKYSNNTLTNHDKFSSLSNKTVVTIFQMFVYGDVVMLRIGRFSPWKTVTVSTHLHIPVRPILLHSMALVSFRLYVRENLGNLWEFFGQMVYRPPWQKISRTVMIVATDEVLLSQTLLRTLYPF